MRAEQCDCKRAHHTHATRIMYVAHKCRCAPCTEAARVYELERRRRILYNRSNLTDAQPIREHIEQLQAQGMGWKRIVEVSGISTSAMSGILYGRGTPGHHEYRPPRKQVTKKLAQKILAVQLDRSPGAKVDATGTRRRLEALVTAGWPISHLAERMGVDHQRIRSCLNGRRSETSEETRRLVTAFFRTAIHGPGGAVPPMAQARARRYATQRGWVPALAWDDIDDPDATPDVTVLRPRAMRSPLEQRITDVEDLATFGEELTEETARRAGWARRDTMLSALRRARRTDLIDQLQANTLRDDRRRA